MDQFVPMRNDHQGSINGGHGLILCCPRLAMALATHGFHLRACSALTKRTIKNRQCDVSQSSQ